MLKANSLPDRNREFFAAEQGICATEQGIACPQHSSRTKAAKESTDGDETSTAPPTAPRNKLAHRPYMTHARDFRTTPELRQTKLVSRTRM